MEDLMQKKKNNLLVPTIWMYQQCTNNLDGIPCKIK